MTLFWAVPAVSLLGYNTAASQASYKAPSVACLGSEDNRNNVDFPIIIIKSSSNKMIRNANYHNQIFLK